MDKLDSLKNKEIGQSAAKPRGGEGSETIPPKGSREAFPEIARLSSCVYGIECPDTRKIIYIGKTIGTLRKRYFEHIQDSKRYNTRISRWMQKRISENKTPRIIPLFCSHPFSLNDAERAFIKQYKEQGFQLLNLTDGGEGALGHVHTEEHKAKISSFMKGRPKSTAQLEKMKATAKPVYMYDLQGKFISKFNSFRDVASFLDCSASTVHYAIRRKGTAKGYQLRNEFEPELGAIKRYYKSEAFAAQVGERNRT